MCVCCAHMRERQIQKHTETHRDIQKCRKRQRDAEIGDHVPNKGSNP